MTVAAAPLQAQPSSVDARQVAKKVAPFAGRGRGVRDPRARPRRPVPAVVELPRRPGHRLGQDVDHRPPVHQLGVLLDPAADHRPAGGARPLDAGRPRLPRLARHLHRHGPHRVPGRRSQGGARLRRLPRRHRDPRRVVRVDPDHVADDRGRRHLAADRRAARHHGRPPPEDRWRPPGLPRRRADDAGLLLPALHGAAVRHRRARRGDRHRDLRPRPGGAPHVARHPLRVGRAHRGRRGARRDQPPGPQQGAVAGGSPGHPPRRQPGDHDGLRRRRHRRARRLARARPVRAQRPREDQRRPGPGRRPGHRPRRRHPRPDLHRPAPRRAPRLRSPQPVGQAARPAHRPRHPHRGRRVRPAHARRALPERVDLQPPRTR